MSKVVKKVAQAAGQVAKMLSPEETALLQDIGAGIQQLLQLNAGEAQPGGEPPEIAAGVAAGMTPEEEEEAKKAAAAKSADGATASDPAEPRTEEPTDITDDNLGALAKALMMKVEEQTAEPEVQMAAKGMDVKALVNGISQQMAPIINKVNTVEKAMETMLDALGFADAIVDEAASVPDGNQMVAKAQGQTTGMTPVVSNDAQGFVDMLSSSIAKAMKEDRVEAAHELQHDSNGLKKARDDLKGSMGFLLNKAKK